MTKSENKKKSIASTFQNLFSTLVNPKTVALLFFIIIISVFDAEAATYYVSNSGNDSNSGTSESVPWQTLSKVQGRTFSPGDSILLKRGNVWYESLRIPSAGTSGNHITLGAYGSGAKPLIVAGNEDAIIVTAANRGYWIIDGLNITSIDNGIYFDYWPSDMGPVPGWIIQNCHFNTSVYVSGPNTVVRNNVFEGKLGNSSRYGAIIFRGYNSNYSVVEGNTVSGFYDRGIWLYNGASHMIVRNNEVYNIKTGSDNGGCAINWDGNGLALRNTLTHNNYIHDIDAGGICYENTYNPEDYQNYVENAGWSGVYVWWYNSQNGAQSNHNSHHNIFVNTRNGFVIHYTGTINISNNIFYKASPVGSERYGLYFTSNTYVRDIVFVNNIIAGTGWAHPVYAPFTDNVFSKFDNNIIIPTGTEIMYRNYVSLNISQVKALGYMNNGLTSNPEFVNAPDDFHLQEGSSGINAGYSTQNTLDYENNPLSGVQDIGAYEYQIVQQTGSITVNSGNGGTASGSASGFIVPATRTITATPNNGYTFNTWTKTSGDCTITNPTSSGTTATINSGTCIVQATFSPIPVGNLTVNCTSGGTVQGSSINFFLPANLTIRATPNQEFFLTNWTKTAGDCMISDPSSDTTTVQVNNGWCYVQAYFNPISVTGNLTVTATSGGTASGNQTNFALPATLQVNASAEPSYRFTSWTILSGDCTPLNAYNIDTAIRISNGWCNAQANFVRILPPNVDVYVSSVDSTINSDLNCIYQASGQNNEPLKIVINWLKNGEITFTNSPPLLPKSNININDKWSCQIVAVDSFSSASQTSEEILIGTAIVDKTEPPESFSRSDKDIHIYNTYVNYTNETIETINIINPPKDENVDADNEDIETFTINSPGTQIDAPRTISPDKVLTKDNKWSIWHFVIIIIILGTLTAIGYKKSLKTDWRVLQFVETSQKNGFRKESIIRVLKTKKYPDRVIMYHLKISRNQILAVLPQAPDSKIYPEEIYSEIRKYVTSQRAHTFTDDEIEEVLGNRGYSKKFVNEVMK